VGLCNVTVVCCCASVWGPVYWGVFGIVTVVCFMRRYGVMYIGGVCLF